MELSYSLHIGNDKNKTKYAKQKALENKTGTTSFNNNAIQNLRHLSKADNHNLRKYDDNPDDIETLIGTNNLVDDVKVLYKDLFDEARLKYNEKQKREDRKINNYFEKIANDDKHDLAVELIIELGDKQFWKDKDNKYVKQMKDVFLCQTYDLENVIPNFKIANATIHFDESSPHMHVVGVAYKKGNKNGMELQVGKADVFNKESLSKFQDELRERCITEFNEVYKTNYKLKEKEVGRNKDIKVKDMQDYSNFKIEKEMFKEEIERLDNSAFKINLESQELDDIMNNLPQSKINKNNYLLTNREKEKINNFIKEAKESTKDMLSTNNLNAILKKYEERLKTQDKEIKKLKDTIRSNNDTIKHNSKNFHEALNNYYKESYKRIKYEKENSKLVEAIDIATGTINGLCNWIYELCADGYIPQQKMEEGQEEIGTLFKKDKGKWINGKYYTEQQLRDMDTSSYL
jgi:hypothetical protein